MQCNIMEAPQKPDALCFMHKNLNYTEQNYKCNTFVFALMFHELNSKI